MTPDERIILGIDPGLRVTGYGIISRSGQKCRALEAGVIRTESSDSLSSRLYQITTGLAEVVDQFSPQTASIEQIFSAVNIKTALLLGHVRGAIIAELMRKGLEIFEYSALEIKQAVVGYGRAEKQQVADMVTILLRLAEPPKPLDASDALAAALCHNNTIVPSATRK